MNPDASDIEVYLSYIVNQLPHFIFWKDRHSVFLGCNQLFAIAAGLPNPDEIVGKTDFDCAWTFDESTAYVADDQRIIESGVAKLNYEESQHRADGEEYVLLISKVPMYNHSGEIIGLLGIYTDITERKKMELAVLQAKEQAETANRLRSEFIRNMEHDIRTPFSGILGVAQLLLDQEEDAEKRSMLMDMTQCAQELLEYCNSILDLSRLEFGSVPVLMKNFSVRAVIDSVLSMESQVARFKGLALTCEYDTHIPEFLIGDSFRVQRILINLVSNAIKFTERGSVTLRIILEKRIDSRHVILKFMVEDTGIGIPEDKQNFIYEKFARLDPSYRVQLPGQGLGLYIVKQLIQELDGDIYLRTVLGQGSCFTVLLPFTVPLGEYR